jgi:hypothetical protein
MIALVIGFAFLGSFQLQDSCGARRAPSRRVSPRSSSIDDFGFGSIQSHDRDRFSQIRA